MLAPKALGFLPYFDVRNVGGVSPMAKQAVAKASVQVAKAGTGHPGGRTKPGEPLAIEKPQYLLCAPDRMVDPGIFARVQETTKASFSFDAACNPQGTNSLCSRFAMSDTFMHTNVAGEALWCCVSPAVVRQFQQHYERCKRSQPHQTCAVFVVPKRPALTQYFRQLGYQLALELPAGAHLMVSANGKGQQGRLPMPPTPWPVQFWYDQPAVTAQIRAVNTRRQNHEMTFATFVNGRKCLTLPDSGANTHGTGDGFTSADAIQKWGLRLQPSPTTSVTLADGGTQSILGKVRVPVRMGALNDTLTLLVMKHGHASADILLSCDWFNRRGANLCYKTRTMSVQRGGRKLVLKPTPDPSDAERLINLVLAVHVSQCCVDEMSPRQAWKSIKRGAEAYLMLVRPETDLTVRPARTQARAATVAAAPKPIPGLVPQPKLDALLDKYKAVFQKVTGLRDATDPIEHTIPLIPGAVPPAKRAYRLSPEEKDECKRQITDLLAKGFIEPSSSPFGAPVIFVKKKDPESPTGHKLRMVLDYRALNKITQKRRYPMPNIQEIFDQLAGASVFSSIDLESGYHQLRISKEDIPKTAFITPEGQFAFKVLCFGLTNAPATFQATMNRYFAKQLGKSVLVYLDDVLIFSKTPEEHLRHLEEVFEVLQTHGLRAKLAKCEFNKAELKFLGHIVGRNGLKVDPDKVRVVKDWAVPRNRKQVRAFLGLANYFRKFIQGYSSLVAPLTALTSEKVPWHWCDKCQKAFEGVKRALISAPVLALPDISKPFEVKTDASIYGTGAVLLQDGKALAYLSHRFTPAEKNYTTTDQEALGVIHALREWRCYLEGAPDVTVVTDHQPLTYLDSLKANGLLSRRQARWIEFLQDKNIKWSYQPGRINVADPLSRIYEDTVPDVPPNQVARLLAAFLAQDTPEPQDDTPCVLATRTRAQTRSDTIPVDIRKQIVDGYASDPKFRNRTWVGKLKKIGDLYYKGEQVMVPDVDSLRSTLLAEYHDGGASGHPGHERLYEAIRRDYLWNGLAADCKRYAAACPDCQRNKASTAKPRGLLQPLPLAKRPWGSVTLDLITQLPLTTSGHDAIIVFVDRLTKMVHFAPTTSDVDAEEAAWLYLQNVFRHHGLADELISDRGPQFAGKFWPEVHKLLRTTVKLSTAFHPQTDGQTERMNRLLEETLRHYVGPRQDDWDQCLPLIEFAINNSMNKSIGSSPFRLYTPYEPRTPANLALPAKHTFTVPMASSLVQLMGERLKRAMSCLTSAQARQKQAADSKRQDATFAVGDLVLLSTKNLALKAPAGGTKKLMPRYIGPFLVESRAGQVAYKLKLPVGYRVHPVFHASLLKPYKGTGTYQPPPAFLDDDGNAYWTVEDILSHRDRKLDGSRSRTVREYLVKWEGFGPEHNSWEPATTLCEDKLVEECIDEYLIRSEQRKAKRQRK